MLADIRTNRSHAYHSLYIPCCNSYSDWLIRVPTWLIIIFDELLLQIITTVIF